MGRVGCKDYHQYGWGGKPATWCFCDFALCNTNVTYIAQTYDTDSIHSQNSIRTRTRQNRRQNNRRPPFRAPNTFQSRLFGWRVLNDMEGTSVRETTTSRSHTSAKPEGRELPFRKTSKPKPEKEATKVTYKKPKTQARGK